jgi:HK97 family phage major capsid protein
MGDTTGKARGISFPPGTVIGHRADGRPIYAIAGGDGRGETPPEGGTRTSPELTHPQAVNRLRDLDGEIGRLAELDSPTPEEEARFEQAVSEFEEVDEWRKHLERQAARARVAQVTEGDLRTASTRFGQGRVERGSAPDARGARRPGSGSMDTYDIDAIMEPDSVELGRFRNPWDLSEMRTFDRSHRQVVAEYRSRALSAAERMSGATDEIRSAAVKLIERWDDEDGRLSRLALTLSEPTYLRAWGKMARNALNPNLDQDEQVAVERVQQAARAMSLTDSAGGFLVPFQLDPTVIITANGSVNQIRQAARQVVATGDVWHGVSSGAVQWSYDAEASQVSDDTPTLAQPTVTIHKAQGFVPISIEAIADAQNVTAEVGRLLAFGKDVLEANAFVLGTGSGQPTGIVTALDGGASVIEAAGDGVFSLADVYTLQGALPARYRNMDSTAWLANNLTYNRIRQFDTAGGAGLWATLGDGRPEGLLSKRALEAEDMDGTITASASNNLLVFGDFDNYVIADRVGMTVEFIPHLFGANQRPTGQRGWYAYVRHGADSVNDSAFRMLDVVAS